MVAHDLRTPLSSITLNLELLGGTPGLDEGAQEDIAYALFSARALAAMISMVVDTARLEAGEMNVELVETPLVTLTRETAGRLAGPAGGAYVVIEADVEVTAHCDRELTRRVIEQLLHGASAVTPQGAAVRVRILGTPDRARIEVRDDGARIPGELRAKTLDKEGMLHVRRHHRHYSRGLGPVFCALAVEAQGGTIGSLAADSGEGRGNTFWFELPAGAPGRHS